MKQTLTTSNFHPGIRLTSIEAFVASFNFNVQHREMIDEAKTECQKLGLAIERGPLWERISEMKDEYMEYKRLEKAVRLLQLPFPSSVTVRFGVREEEIS